MSLEAQLPALQVAVPLTTAPLLVLLRVRGLAWIGATAASLMSFAIAVALARAVLGGGVISYDVGGWEVPYGIELRIDALSALLLLVVTGASSIALLAGRASLDADIEPERQPMFYAAWLLAVAGFAGIVVAGDAFNIFVFMEIGSLATYILVAGGTDRRALPAVFKYLVMGTIGATFYLIGVGLIYMMTGTLNLADMEERMHVLGDIAPIVVAAGVITIGLALKSAVFPLHVWLPNAYTYAPHIVTAFIAACGTKVSLYVMLRVDLLVLQPNLSEHAAQFALFLMPLGVLGMLVASAVALSQRHLKRMLAYSSVAQIGYILLGVSMLSAAGLTGGVLHFFNHALAKGALFLAVACLGMRFGSLHIATLAGAGARMPLTMAAFVLAGLSLVGVPGTAGFVSKWYLVLAALEHGALGWLLVGAIVVSSLLALAYVWRVVEVAYFAAPAAAGAEAAAAGGSPAGEAPWSILLPTWIAVLANVVFGLYPAFPLALSREAATLLLRFVQ